MSDLQVVTNRPAFNNKLLEKATQLIMSYDNTIKTRQYDIAYQLGQIQLKELYKDDGFQSCAEYAMSTFGIEKTLAYELIDIGMHYIRPYYDKTGKKCLGHCSNLVPACHPEIQDAPLIDFTTNKIGKLKVLGRDKLLELIEKGDVTPQMTFRDLASVVKLNKAKKVKALPQDATQPPQDATEDDEPDTLEPLQETAQDATQPPQDATEDVPNNDNSVHMENRKVGVERDTTFDNISTDILIAELRARGYHVYKDNNEISIDWQ